MRRRIRNVFWGCIGAAFFALGICFITNLLDPGYAYSKNKEFMEDSHRMDVLFFGIPIWAMPSIPWNCGETRGLSPTIWQGLDTESPLPIG